MAVTAILSCALVCTSILSSGPLAMWTLILVGIANSIMFPSIVTLGIPAGDASPERGRASSSHRLIASRQRA